MELMRCKTRLAVLWLIKAIGFTAFWILSFVEPGKIEGLMAGKVMGMQVSDGQMVMFGLFWWVPWIMAWLSLTLKGSANRWANFVLAVLFFIAITFDTIHFAGECSVAMQVDQVLGILVSALIAWYAWKLPKEEVQTIS